MHSVDSKLGLDCDLRPDGFYGLSKVWGEAMTRMYWDKHGIEGICLRIGTAIEKPTEFRHLSTWLGNDDLVQLIERCITVPDIGYLVVWGVSANTRSYWDNAGAAAAWLPADAECRGLRRGDPAADQPAGPGGAALPGWRLRHHRLHAAGATAAAVGA